MPLISSLSGISCSGGSWAYVTGTATPGNGGSEGKSPFDMKISMNNHYTGTFLEPWGERSQQGYGIEVFERFVREVAFVEHGGESAGRDDRLTLMRQLAYNDLANDRQVVAAVQALEAILDRAANGEPDCIARINNEHGGLTLYRPGHAEPEVLYDGLV